MTSLSRQRPARGAGTGAALVSSFGMRWGMLLALLIGCGGRIDEDVDAGPDGAADVYDAADVLDSEAADANDATDAPEELDAPVDVAMESGEAGTCKSDGTTCTSASECCSGTCDALGACGTLTCPNGPTKCEACIGQSCCTQDLACGADPNCLPIWKCFRTCIEANNGTNGAACVNQCMPAPYEPNAFKFYQCGYYSCGYYCL